MNMMAGLEKPDEGEIRRGCKISFPLGFMGGVSPTHGYGKFALYRAALWA